MGNREAVLDREPETQYSQTIDTGLNGVPVCASDISVTTVDEHEHPFLIYRGYSIYDLVKGSFEEAAYLVLNGDLPDLGELEAFDEILKDCRILDRRIVAHIRTYPGDVNRMDFLHTVLSFARMFDEDYENPLWMNFKADADATSRYVHDVGIRMGARIPAIIAYGHRILNGMRPIPPDNKLPHAANFLRMLGLPSDKDSAKALDATLTLYLDHTMNNSTFLARASASARPDPYGPFLAASVGLKGVLHGGANEMASHMIDEIGTASRAEEFVMSRLARGEVIYGFGHRLAAYKHGIESRVIIAEGIARELAAKKGAKDLMDIYDILKDLMMGDHVEERKRRTPNLDLPVAIIYKILGIPAELNTPLFQSARHFGWVAHVSRQCSEKGPLYRPTQRDIFDGIDHLRKYLPIEDRF